jgi:hypothetical protein
MNSSLQTAALKACRHFMLPIARFLLKNGIGYREFAEISKLAFVQVASDDHGIRGRKTNMSRVSVMTGLNRKEVRKIRHKLAESDWSLNPALSKPVSVLSEWYTSRRYLDSRGRPKSLPFVATGNRISFSGLVREVGGDVPPGAMLKELTRASCVVEEKPGVWKAVKRQYAPGGIDPFQVERFGECLHDLAQTISNNMGEKDGKSRLFEFRAWSNKVDSREVPKLRRIVASHGNRYLEAIDDWLGAHSLRDASISGAQPMRCGVGVYYFEQPRVDVGLAGESTIQE